MTENYDPTTGASVPNKQPVSGTPSTHSVHSNPSTDSQRDTSYDEPLIDGRRRRVDSNGVPVPVLPSALPGQTPAQVKASRKASGLEHHPHPDGYVMPVTTVVKDAHPATHIPGHSTVAPPPPVAGPRVRLDYDPNAPDDVDEDDDSLEDRKAKRVVQPENPSNISDSETEPARRYGDNVSGNPTTDNTVR